jgi:hypothetical protein
MMAEIAALIGTLERPNQLHFVCDVVRSGINEFLNSRLVLIVTLVVE